jgi:hypothetical protein
MPEFPPSFGAVEMASYLPYACVAKCRLMQIMEQLGSASGHLNTLVVVTETKWWGVTDCSLCLVEQIQHHAGHEAASFCCVKLDRNSLGD